MAIENLPVDNRSHPLQPIVISNCGELVLQRTIRAKGTMSLCLLRKLITWSCGVHWLSVSVSAGVAYCNFFLSALVVTFLKETKYNK